MRRLRDPVSGCEWDREQSFATIAPYTIEEAYEVADAIARDDMDALAAELDAESDHRRMLEELGDLLFAVVNLARHLNIEPEAALREANAKFEQRFRSIEKAPGFADLSLEEKEELWVAAKKTQTGSIA